MNLRVFAGACCVASLLHLPAAAAHDLGEGLISLAPSKVLLEADGQSVHWNGIGRIKSKKGSHCTATLIDTRSPDSPDDAPAYLLTNGHCISRRNGLIITDSEIKGTVQFNFFTDSLAYSYPLKRVNWSSMQGVDLAIVELQPTLASLIADGIQPLRLTNQMPEDGREILSIGAPLYIGTGHLRMAACVHQSSGEILQQPWVWRHTVSNQCKDIAKGSSGSPLLTRDTGEVFAVLNLTNQPSPESSAAKGEVTLPPGFPPQAVDSNFGSPVTSLNECFIDGVLTTDPQQCRLFPVHSILFEKPPGQFAKVRLDALGNEVYPSWDLQFRVDKPFYRYKKVDSPLECENPVGYSATITSRDARIDDPIDARVGINWLCIIGASSADERPSHGMMRNALTLAVELLAAGPTSDPQVHIKKNRFGSYEVNWLSDPGRIDYYTAKIGPVSTTDCTDPQGFRRRLGSNLVLRKKSLPMKICTYAHDANGQRSSVREDIVSVSE
ncbi:trypsin-like peptidase domain-containing protein [Pseudomonas cichorii]|uniref:trypsin-like serine peptidase n=1 Tax=Pseudomonas cichorii TaxID=36746 RepID=UPI0018E5DCE8|nr:serine protease [Pseudomonas cichorii]MBI6854357.1 trypsin-like peptidase domain-containing protein [Pseudomonas cichorii]